MQMATKHEKSSDNSKSLSVKMIDPFQKIDNVVKTYREKYKKEEEELQSYLEYKSLSKYANFDSLIKIIYMC